MDQKNSNPLFQGLSQIQKQWEEEQIQLSAQVVIPLDRAYFPKKEDIILALDIQYHGDEAHVAGNLFSWEGKEWGTYAGVTKVDAPYIPSYFCFREGPPLFNFIKTLEKKSLPMPNLIIVDGHGIAHPRRFGVACWLGVMTKIPTLGCAKETLLSYQGELAPEQGSVVSVFLEKEIVGYVIRYQDKINPIFGSPGHLVSLVDCKEIILKLPGEFRIPDPLRKADHAARNHCKGVSDNSYVQLGVLESKK